MGIGLGTARFLQQAGDVVLDVGYAVRDFLVSVLSPAAGAFQVVLDVLVVVVFQGGEVIQMGLGLWVHVLQWVTANYFLIALIGLVVGLG